MTRVHLGRRMAKELFRTLARRHSNVVYRHRKEGRPGGKIAVERFPSQMMDFIADDGGYGITDAPMTVAPQLMPPAPKSEPIGLETLGKVTKHAYSTDKFVRGKRSVYTLLGR